MRLAPQLSLTPPREFQSTHPRGVRLFLAPQSSTRTISIHAPTWGATTNIRRTTAPPWISIHAPTWGATPVVVCDTPDDKISIHAPTWGATRLMPWPSCRPSISIHAPTWGATQRSYTCQTPWHFNPRTHVGCDGTEALKVALVKISIHAPTWGATRVPPRRDERHTFQSTHPRGVRPSNLVRITLTPIFQSTHPRGVRPPGSAQWIRLSLFQSTHPRGVRPRSSCRCSRSRPHFNPRTHVGCDEIHTA